MMRKLIPMLILCAAIAGCSLTDKARRSVFLKQNPKTTEEVSNAIKKGELLNGMSTKEVEAAWGEPSSKRNNVDGDEHLVEWNFGKRKISAAGLTADEGKKVLFRDGKVIKFDP